MSGCVIPNTPIAVDFWKLRDCPKARVFFLTHLHGDHVTGLTSSWNYPIYCSEVTATLLKRWHGVNDALVNPLELDTSHIIYLDNERREQMTVTLIDANHCPGAVMFLFEGYFGTILHTGDFRFNTEMISRPPLSRFTGKIDMMYLDNTYNSRDCCFPSREEATIEIIRIIQAHPTHDIILGLRNLGKETLLCKIALEVHEWISVPSRMYGTLQLLNAPNIFVRDDITCRIRVVAFHTISNRFVKKLNEARPTIAILPTAIYCGIDARPYENQDDVFVVHYSDHSSYSELVSFVSYLTPSSIIPIVKAKSRGPFGVSIADRADMSSFAKYLTKNVTTPACIPEAVRKFMKSKSMCLPSGRGVKRKPKQHILHRSVKRGVIFDSPGENDAEGDYVSEEYECSQTVVAAQSRADNCIICGKIQTKNTGDCCENETHNKEIDKLSTDIIHIDGEREAVSNDSNNDNSTVVELYDKVATSVNSSQGFQVEQETNEITLPETQEFEVTDEVNKDNSQLLDEENRLEVDENYVSADEAITEHNMNGLTDSEDNYETASEHSTNVRKNNTVTHAKTKKLRELPENHDFDNTSVAHNEIIKTTDDMQPVDNIMKGHSNKQNNTSKEEFEKLLIQNKLRNDNVKTQCTKPPLDFLAAIGKNGSDHSPKGIIAHFNTELANYNKMSCEKQGRRNVLQTRLTKQNTESALSTAEHTKKLLSTSPGKSKINQHLDAHTCTQRAQSTIVCPVICEKNDIQQNDSTDSCILSKNNDAVSESNVIVIEDSVSSISPSEYMANADKEDIRHVVDYTFDQYNGVSRCSVYIRDSNSRYQTENKAVRNLLEDENETDSNSEESQSLLQNFVSRPETHHENCTNVMKTSGSHVNCDKFPQDCEKTLETNCTVQTQNSNLCKPQNMHNSSNQHGSICHVCKENEHVDNDNNNHCNTQAISISDNCVHSINTYHETASDHERNSPQVLQKCESTKSNMCDIDKLPVCESETLSKTVTGTSETTSFDCDQTSIHKKDIFSAISSRTGRATWNVIDVQYQDKEFRRRKLYRTLKNCISQIK